MAARREVFGAVVGNRDLRRVEFAYAGFNACEYAVWIAMLLYAYNRGGATMASLVAVIQLAPAALFAPIAAALIDRHPPVRVLCLGYVAQAAGMGATAAAILLGGPAALAYVCAAVAATAVTITRPTQAALLPALAHSPEELTASNVVSGWVENGSILVATTGTGLLLGVTGPGGIFAIMTVTALAAALLVAPVNGPAAATVAGEGSDLENAAGESMAGFRTIRQEASPRLLLALLAVELTVFGALDVLFVPLAISELGRGQSWVGFLNAAFALGALAGSMASVSLVGRRRLLPPITGGLLLWACVLMAIAIHPTVATALILIVIGGAGRSVFDLSARTLLQRVTPSDVLGRVFGILEGIEMAALGVGALIVPLLFALNGVTGALVGVGVLLIATVAVTLRPLRRVDQGSKVPIVEIMLLRSLPIFAPLPAPALEGLAHALEPIDAPAGCVIVRQGDVGDRFYAIADGEVEVTCDDIHVADLARGDGFGEIALLSEVPRTASVTARTPTRLYALDAAPFVTAVTGHPPVAHAASTLVQQRRTELAEL